MLTGNVSSKKGGVCLYIRNSYSVRVLNDISFVSDYLEALFVEVCLAKHKYLLIGMIYRRPGTVLRDFMQKMDELLTKIDRQKCVLLGDFNLNLNK